MNVRVLLLLVVALVAASCRVEPSRDDLVEFSPTPIPTKAPPDPETTFTESFAEAEEEGSTSASEPAPTVVIDDTVVVQGDDWTITQTEVNQLILLVEETHELTFSDPVGVVVSDDIGLEFARGFEPFQANDWALFRGLGLAESEQQRLEANQLRLDRIRGFCCAGLDGGGTGEMATVVELQDTKFATELIIVHELTHALHRQNPELFPGPLDVIETPLPPAAGFEGVPQFVTFGYISTGSLEDRAAVAPDLPIIRNDQLDLIPNAAARHLNFAYEVGPTFVDAVVAARGIQGLSDVIKEPPITTEQVLFPAKYLAGEQAERVSQPELPTGAFVSGRGTIGSAMLWFLLTEEFGETTALAMVEPWAGDTYVAYELGNDYCLAANIMMDTAGVAVSFADSLKEALLRVDPVAEVSTEVSGAGMVALQVCHGG